MGLNTGQTIVQGDFVSVSSGATDQNKVNKLDAAGKNPVDFNGFEGVRVKQNAGTSTSSSETVLPFQAEDFDTNTFHDNTTNNSRITIPAGKGGKYLIGAVAGANNDIRIRIRLNGVTDITAANGEGFTYCYAACSTVYVLSAGDYLEVFCTTNGASSTSGDHQTNFWAYRLSA